ncbi:MAG: hypothetical protein LBP20_00955, partial [Treponema sp.]|nr:hypothetical protein [Treponema sp.]
MNYEEIEIIPSKGSSGAGAVVPIKDNILLPEFVTWPPRELNSKLTKSKHLEDFETKYHQKLIQELGYYCDLASIKSEDAMTWSLFGFISKMKQKIQNNFYNEFLKKLNYGGDEIVSMELWKTLPHPETPNKKGPEIDVFMAGEKYYILTECKWTSDVEKKQGKGKNLDQMQIRNMFKNGIGKSIFPGKEGIIVLVANKNIDDNLFISWDELSKFESLPHKE